MADSPIRLSDVPERKLAMECGAVRFNERTFCIEFRPPEYHGDVYEIDLEETDTAAQLLDWIFQIFQKRWCTPRILADLLTVMDDVCRRFEGFDVQGSYCPWGEARTVNWRRHFKDFREGRHEEA